MSIVKIAKRKDVTFEYDANGFAQEEVLKGECDQAKFVRCSLQPGKSVKPELYSTVEHTQVFLFLEGKGYITTPRKGFNIKNEFAVFVPDYDTEEFENLENIRFICMDARDIEAVFAPAEVDKIFLNFSDPWPKARHAKRRLTSTEFLARYEKVLVENGRVEFKTDNTELFNFSLEQVKEAGWELLAYTYDLHHQEEMNKGNIMTEYEQKFSEKGNPINKLIAQRK